ADWIQALEAATVPCGPINNMQEVFEDPQVQHRNMRVDIPHPLGTTAPVVASPMRLSKTPVTMRMPPPLLGEHTEEILSTTLHYTHEQIAQLRSKGIID
ncbi:MAG: CoA transferase, partial [Betaproteobacteria bacterium]|nr:CoA transferase [Betaproteobacteria bacterium]